MGAVLWKAGTGLLGKYVPEGLFYTVGLFIPPVTANGSYANLGQKS